MTTIKYNLLARASIYNLATAKYNSNANAKCLSHLYNHLMISQIYLAPMLMASSTYLLIM